MLFWRHADGDPLRPLALLLIHGLLLFNVDEMLFVCIHGWAVLHWAVLHLFTLRVLLAGAF